MLKIKYILPFILVFFAFNGSYANETTEKSYKELTKLQTSLANDLKKTNSDLDKIAKSLREIESKYNQKYISKHDLKRLYQESLIYWRTLADNSLKVFSQKDNPKYDDSHLRSQTEYNNILKLKRELKIANKNYQSDLLLKSGKLRASILQTILSFDEDFITYDNEYFQYLVRELKLIPYQPIIVFYSKILQYRQTIDSGFTGFVYILQQIGLLILLIITIFISRKSLTKLTNLFNLLTQFTIKKSISDKSYIKPAIIISKITPYFKWLVLISIFTLVNVIIEKTIFAELGVLIPYFQYYFLYKIFRIFAHNGLTDIVYSSINHQNQSNHSLNQKIKKTTKTLGYYLFGVVYIMHLTQSIVDKAYFYDLTLNIFLIGLVFILAIIASDWKEEIKIVAKEKLSKRSFRIINKLLSGKKSSILFSLPILSILVVKGSIHKVTSMLGNYDFFKNILSQIYRRKLESAAKMVEQDDDSASVNDSYIDLFEKNGKNDIFIPIKNHPNEEFQTIMENWLSGKSEENSIAIHSEKGIGKTRFLEKIITDNKEIQVLQTSFERKITDKNELIKIISGLFNKKSGEKALFNALAKCSKKTVIILDDCHNLFLAKEGGFDALKLLFDMLVKINNPNLLWIATFNSYSWNYLQHCHKINNYFRYVLRLPRWSDENIKELILHKHEKTGLKLVYDPLIFAINTNKTEKEFEDTQQKFFQIIWSQSRGNPTIAMSLWLSSLKKEGSKSVKISLPKLAKSSQLNSLPDEHLFIYGAIVKHQNLSIDEISTMLSTTPEEVINTIRIGLEKGYLEIIKSDKKRFTSSPEWQTAINQLLTNRNFVYAE